MLASIWAFVVADFDELLGAGQRVGHPARRLVVSVSASSTKQALVVVESVLSCAIAVMADAFAGILFVAEPVRVSEVAVTLNPMTLHQRRCREVRAHMSAYLDGELDATSATRVKRHVRWCPNCRRILKNLTRTITGLRALEAQDPPLA
ncbi:MAG: zf-HC2 domain-containing protein [Solirubrobacteraceae bacterium]